MTTKKVVINCCFGGFGVSEACLQFMNIPYTKDEKSGYLMYEGTISRTDPKLIAAIETLGSEACSDKFSELAIVEIPSEVQFTIEDYDGSEHIAEVHRTWHATRTD